MSVYCFGGMWHDLVISSPGLTRHSILTDDIYLYSAQEV